MRIGGLEVSSFQCDVLAFLVKHGSSRLGTWNKRTVRALQRRGLIESFVPDATTLAMAERGRVHYYRLTAAGKAANRMIREQSRG
jgi:hypothetical protein